MKAGRGAMLRPIKQALAKKVAESALKANSSRAVGVAAAPTAAPPPVDTEFFRQAVAGTTPLAPHGRVIHPPAKPQSTLAQRLARERATIDESDAATNGLQDRPDSNAAETSSYLRPSLPRQLLRDLRRGRWAIEAELDLHGANRDQARALTADFLDYCRSKDQRVVRIIHGRGLGVPGGSGLLKNLVRDWLTQHADVLAYCQAKPQDGGEGAVIALLKAQ